MRLERQKDREFFVVGRHSSRVSDQRRKLGTVSRISCAVSLLERNAARDQRDHKRGTNNGDKPAKAANTSLLRVSSQDEWDRFVPGDEPLQSACV